MKSRINSFIQRETVWPDSYDDRVIDEIIWDEIAQSHSAGDFASYLVHRPQAARHIETARIRYDSIDPALDTTPLGYLRAIERIRQLALDGDAAAMFHMGKIYSIGIALEQDFSQAESWYLAAIALGEMRAHCNLGWLYQSGFGLPQQSERAFELLSTGARHGISVAKATVGMMLLSGEGCTAAPEEGLSMLAAAFDEGYNNAANCIADACFSGDHLPQDIDLAFRWLGRAADRGDVRTMAILGHYLITGSHGLTDVARGVAYLVGAVNRGYPPAHLWLGKLYEHGEGVERNSHMARTMYEKGIFLGDEECQFALASLLNGALSPTDDAPPSLN